jgi:hypothetical protein
MGNIASPWRYDVAARDALQLANLRCSAIQHHASAAAVFPISGSVRLPFGCGHFEQSRERRDGPERDIKNVIEARSHQLT